VIKRRALAFQLTGFFLMVMFGGFFALAWFLNDVIALIAR
tara:strand:- start:2068 stop:2187 length:120 start_codon:yes stop_codon:yes gene_type:complete